MSFTHGWKAEEQKGREAFGKSIPHDRNPFNYFRNSPANIGKAAAWSAGWKKAELEKEQVDQNIEQP